MKVKKEIEKSKKNSNIEEYYEHNKNNAFSNKFIKINNETNNNFSFINSLNSQNHIYVINVKKYFMKNV